MHSASREKAGAIFGEATLHFAERWSASGGLRLSREENFLDSLSTGYQPEPTLLAGDYDSDDLSWRLDLKFAANDDVMLYGSVSTGHKSGGVTAVPARGELDYFEPENVVAYEAGGKSRWLHERLTLNAAAFYYDFEDLQVSTTFLIARWISHRSVQCRESRDLWHRCRRRVRDFRPTDSLRRRHLDADAGVRGVHRRS